MSIGTMDTVLTHTISLLGAAVIVAIIARRMRLPYTVGLVRAGLAVAGLSRSDILAACLVVRSTP
jgi:Kef-type K+ transport system membrane component KefB